MAMEGNVMKMRQVIDIAVPAGGSVELKPGGLHLMFMNIKAPLTAGESVPVKLKFAKAGEVEVKMPVNAMGQSGGAMKHWVFSFLFGVIKKPLVLFRGFYFATLAITLNLNPNQLLHLYLRYLQCSRT